MSHDEASARLRPLLTLSNLTLPSKRVYLRALDIFAAQLTLDFEDALVIAHMERRKLTELYSYESDFDGTPGIARVEP